MINGGSSPGPGSEISKLGVISRKNLGTLTTQGMSFAGCIESGKRRAVLGRTAAADMVTAEGAEEVALAGALAVEGVADQETPSAEKHRTTARGGGA